MAAKALKNQKNLSGFPMVGGHFVFYHSKTGTDSFLTTSLDGLIIKYFLFTNNMV
jgi:hypothetical protein